jgi:hypothetical protein
VDIITSFRHIHSSPKITTMKFPTTLQSAKSAVLAGATLAAAIFSNMAPSLAVPPNGILLAPNRPALAIFNDAQTAFAIGCPALDRLWAGVPHQQVPTQLADKILSGTVGRVEHMYCGNNANVRAYISPAFGAMTGFKADGLIVLNQKPYFVSSREFFTAMGITNISYLSKSDGESIIKEYAPFGNPFKSIVLSVRK